MGAAVQPRLADLNITRLIAESVPAQIRTVQSKLRELEESRSKYRQQLDRLIETAVLHGIEFFPQDNGNAASPGGADGAAIRGETSEPDSASNVTPLSRARA